MIMNLAIAMAALAAGASALPETLEFRGKDVLVFDSAGIPIFRSSRSFLLKIAHNEEGTVVDYDPLLRRVRVSTIGTELWVHCGELQPMKTSCASAQTRPRRMRSSTEDSDALIEQLSRGLPACPGDPRCPRIDN